jgi:hypothetical protein
MINGTIARGRGLAEPLTVSVLFLSTCVILCGTVVVVCAFTLAGVRDELRQCREQADDAQRAIEKLTQELVITRRAIAPFSVPPSGQQ